MIFKKSSKEDLVYEKIEKFLTMGKECIEKTSETLQGYLEKDENFTDASYAVHQIESNADDIRREIEQLLCQGAFLPFFRADIINFLEQTDEVLDKCESLCDYLVLFKPEFPEDITYGLMEILDHTLKAYSFLVNAYHDLMDDMSAVMEICLKIEREEGKIDKIEWNLQKMVFENEKIDLAQKLLIRDFITFIADLSDIIENSSDRIELIQMTRNI